MKTTKETKTLIHKFARIDAGESESQKTLQELLALGVQQMKVSV